VTGPTDEPDVAHDGDVPVDDLVDDVRDDAPGDVPGAEVARTGDGPDFEGPRRRARREREERRAAQERATAIENARREAKRRVAGRPVDEPKPSARGLIRGL
jgi:cell division protein FtsQ